MHRALKGREHRRHSWGLFALLALITLYLISYPTEIGIPAFATRRTLVEQASTLEPVFSPPSGYYDCDIQVHISGPGSSTGEPSGVIFTVDGSVPTPTTGTSYTQPIRLSAATPAVTVIRARAMLADGTLGPVVSGSYFVGVPATLPIMSLIVDPEDLWNPESGIFAQFDQRGDVWERPVDITYADRDRDSGFHVPGGIRVHGGGSRSFPKKSMRLYFRQEYGLNRLEYPLFADNNVRSFKRLVLHNGGQDMSVPLRENWTLIRNQLADGLALQIDGYASHNQPILVFINGEPWGIYQIREYIDGRFLEERYDIETADLLDSPESDLQAVLAGDREHWEYLLQFVETHELTDPANYAYIETQADIGNIIDYNILQIYAANTNWPYHNMHQFRPRGQGGRWHWLFWDTDHGFGLAPRGHANFNLTEYVLDYDHPETGGRDVLLLRKLLDSPAFFERFLSRAADLLNTTLAPESVISHIDALTAELEPDIIYEMSRWPNSANWASNVEKLREFARHRPHFVRQHVVECFGLSGTVSLILNPPSSGSGTVAVNDILVQDLPWHGVYFQDIPIQVSAAPAPGYRFAGWDPPHLLQTPVITLTVATTQTITPHFEAVSDDASQPGDIVFTGYQAGEDSYASANGGDRIELLVVRPGGVDLRGWRVTDNDTKPATDEGSLIFADDPALARVPQHTVIVVIATPVDGGDLSEDDLDAWDRRLVLFVGNGNLDTGVDPGFNLGPNDNLVLLAPGPTEAFSDDQGIAFVSESAAVTPASFGVLTDGVLREDAR